MMRRTKIKVNVYREMASGTGNAKESALQQANDTGKASQPAPHRPQEERHENMRIPHFRLISQTIVMVLVIPRI
jgi:hypothetical protein